MAPVKTKPKPRREAAYGEPPVPTVRKGANDAIYERRAKDALRKAMDSTSYEDLAAKLRRKRVDISDKGLENKIARGTFTAAFLFQCLDALGVKRIDVSE